MTQPARRLILVRHGQTEWNAGGRMQGQIDTELTEAGRSQAKEAARELGARRPVLVVSSDLRRAWDSAAILAENCADPVVLRADPRLRETGLGEWEGLDHVTVDERYPGVRARWRFDATLTPPGGENRVDVAARAVPVVEGLLAELPEWAERPVILVAHGGVIAALTAALLELSVENWPILGGLGNASWVELSAWSVPGSRRLRWRLDVWNASAKVAPDVL